MRREGPTRTLTLLKCISLIWFVGAFFVVWFFLHFSLLTQTLEDLQLSIVSCLPSVFLLSPSLICLDCVSAVAAVLLFLLFILFLTFNLHLLFCCFGFGFVVLFTPQLTGRRCVCFKSMNWWVWEDARALKTDCFCFQDAQRRRGWRRQRRSRRGWKRI